MATVKQIPWAKPYFTASERRYVAQALKTTWISRGPFAHRFEQDFTRLLKSPYGLATSNGTVSLQLALMALGVGSGDEVIVPALTFVSPVNMVLAVGAKPVYADIDAKTWCIDPKEVERLVTPRTKAVIVVHLYGNVCDMTAITKIARKYGLALIEDTAEAVFSKFNGRYAGTWGDVGSFSFHAAKTITMGEGGFVVTGRKDLFDKMERMADQGMVKSKRYWHDILGFNFRLTDMQAAVGCGQLDSLKKIVQSKKRIFSDYRRELKGCLGVELQYFQDGVDPLVWAVAVKLDPKVFKMERDEVIKAMHQKGIETRPGFYPFSVMPFFKAPSLPVAERVGLNLILLPSFVTLRSSEIKKIVNTLKKMVA